MYGVLTPQVLRTALLTATTALLLAPASAGQAAPARPGPVDVVGLDFQLVNDLSRRCLAGPAAGGLLVQRTCDRTAPYRWRFAPESAAGTFHIVHAGTGRCLTAAARRVVLTPCDGRAVHSWRLLDSADPNAQIRNEATGRCLTVAGATAVPYACDNRRARRWTVRVLSVPFLGAVGPVGAAGR